VGGRVGRRPGRRRDGEHDEERGEQGESGHGAQSSAKGELPVSPRDPDLPPR